MEREYISTQSFFTDFLIKERFLVTNVSRRIAKNGTLYYNISLTHKLGILNAKRFTNSRLEFESLNSIYLVGNFVEIEGIYQYEWHSVKITSEKIIENIIEKHSPEIHEENGFDLQKEKLTVLKNHSGKFDELIRLFKLGTTIQIKSHIDDMVKSHFPKATKKKIKEFQKYIEDVEYLKWPEDRQDEFLEEYYSVVGRYKAMQPAKWRKWGSYLLKLISLLR